ncbi:beta-galactosidase [Herpetosiphon giganteus]|uniref:beta-galactosidase n=1 Tax=Herpetosiphon giganteus TaxID=2029754 RepID=UPI001957ED7F|nr:beta-galactosidase [Herpetosiphon giganteus]MBM7846133.1 beta-galactosidase [Herpetosiphon giganteus]
MSVTLTANGLAVNGQEVPVYSGTIHYWRLERDRWEYILDQAKALGFSMVETYIPWGVHETAPGEYDWGQIDPRKDLAAFIRLCYERAIWLIVRPGPLINAELTDFGFPKWILDDPAMQARTALDTLHFSLAAGLHPPHQFPVPSYTSPEYMAAVGVWFDHMCQVIVPQLAPHGPIVAVQSDNETCYMFHEQAYATDYSPSALALYQAMLAEQYGAIEELNHAYATNYASFEAVVAPRDADIASRPDLIAHLDWVRYKEVHVNWIVATMADMLRERGVVDVPLFHDVAFQYRTPLDINAMEANGHVDWVGINYYRQPQGFDGATTLVRYMAGTTRLPFIPEFGSGLWIHHAMTPMPAETEFVSLAALMYGVKAFNFYMLVERDRWLACPITRHGDYRPEYAQFFERLLGFLQQQQWWNFQRKPEALVLMSYDLGRYRAATSTLHYGHVDLLGLPPALNRVELDLGFGTDLEAESDDFDPQSWYGSLRRTLEINHIDYDLSDSHLRSTRIADYKLVFAQSVDWMSNADQQRLLQAAEAGATVWLGPTLPTLDEYFQPCTILADQLAGKRQVALGAGHLGLLSQAELGPFCAELAAGLPVRPQHQQLAVTSHHYQGREIVFIANPTAEAINSSLDFAQPVRLTSIWGAFEGAALQPQHPLSLAAYTIAIVEVQHD